MEGSTSCSEEVLSGGIHEIEIKKFGSHLCIATSDKLLESVIDGVICTPLRQRAAESGTRSVSPRQVAASWQSVSRRHHFRHSGPSPTGLEIAIACHVQAATASCGLRSIWHTPVIQALISTVRQKTKNLMDSIALPGSSQLVLHMRGFQGRTGHKV